MNGKDCRVYDEFIWFLTPDSFSFTGVGRRTRYLLSGILKSLRYANDAEREREIEGEMGERGRYKGEHTEFLCKQCMFSSSNQFIPDVFDSSIFHCLHTATHAEAFIPSSPALAIL